MDQQPIFQPSDALAKDAHIDADGYQALYAESIADPNAFWAKHGNRIDWIKQYSQVSDVSYDAKNPADIVRLPLHRQWRPARRR